MSFRSSPPRHLLSSPILQWMLCLPLAIVLVLRCQSGYGQAEAGKEIVAKIVQENGKPAITEGKVAAVDKGSNAGITEGDLFTLRRQGEEPEKRRVIAIVAAVFPETSILRIPGDRPGTTILPSDVFVHEVPDANRIVASPQIGHATQVNTIEFSADDSLLASGASDGLVKIWTLTDGRLAMTLKASGVGIVGVRFTPDDKRVITASEEDHNNLKVWNVSNGKILTSLGGHKRRLNNVAISQDSMPVETALR